MDWDQALFDRARYRRVFERLAEQAAASPRLASSAPVDARTSLAWVLRHEEEITAAIVKLLARGELELSAQKRSVVGKKRIVYLSSWPDRVLLKVMGDALAEAIQPAPSVYSFRRGRGPHAAVAALRAFLSGREPLFVVQRDVSSFGESIRRDELFRLLRARVGLEPTSLFARLLLASLRVEVRVEGEAPFALHEGLLAGSPVVPPLENLYLAEIDDALARLPGFYVRYGDDMLFAAQDASVAADAGRIIGRACERLGLRLSPEKQRDTCWTFGASGAGWRASSAIEWLGHRLQVNGDAGCKRASLRERKGRLVREIDRFVGRAAGLPGDREQLLRAGLTDLLDPQSECPYLQELARGPLAAELDRAATHAIVRALGRRFELSRKESWRLFRKLRVASFQRRARSGREEKARVAR